MLEKAKTLVRQREAVWEQQQTLQGDKIDMPGVVDAVSQKSSQKKVKPVYHKNNHKQPNTDSPKKCFRCGKNPHPRNACPAKDVICRKCQKRGHFAAVCRTKTIHNVEQESQTLDSFYLDTIQDAQDCNFWTTEVKVNNVSVTFKVDTGAEVTAISEDTLKTLEVKEPTKKLCGPNGQTLDLIGSLTVTMTQNQYKCSQDIFVVKQLKCNLLGLPAIKGLHLLTMLDNMEVDPAITIKQQFPKMFTGLGTLHGDYKI